MQVALFAQLILILSVSSMLGAGQIAASEEAELASFAQDVYRQAGINIPRSAFELKEMQLLGRVFHIRIVSRRSELSEDLLQAFLVGGAVSQHAKVAMDLIVLEVDIEFSHEKTMILQAEGACCEKLYNNRMDPDIFSENCLRIDDRNE